MSRLILLDNYTKMKKSRILICDNWNKEAFAWQNEMWEVGCWMWEKKVGKPGRRLEKYLRH